MMEQHLQTSLKILAGWHAKQRRVEDCTIGDNNNNKENDNKRKYRLMIQRESVQNNFNSINKNGNIFSSSNYG